MIYQALFYQKKKKTMKKYSRLSSAAVVIGALRVNASHLFRSLTKTCQIQKIQVKLKIYGGIYNQSSSIVFDETCNY